MLQNLSSRFFHRIPPLIVKSIIPNQNLIHRHLWITGILHSKWNVGKINHVALAVNDLNKSIQFYKNVLGAKVTEPEPQEEHGVYTVFVELGDTKIELLYPLGDKSPIEGFLKKNPAGGIHHICLEVSDIREAIKSMTESGIRVLNPEPKIGAHGKPVVFLHPKDCGGVLTELEEV